MFHEAAKSDVKTLLSCCCVVGLSWCGLTRDFGLVHADESCGGRAGV